MLTDSLKFHNVAGITVLAELARQGHTDVVDGLSSEPAALRDAVYGYAMGGYTEKVNKLIGEHPELTAAAIMGYTRAERYDHADPLVAKDKALRAAKVEGHAQAGNIEAVNAALRGQQSTQYELPAVRGLAANGQHETELLALLSASKYYTDAIQVAAQCGHKSLVDKIFLQLKINPTADLSNTVILPSPGSLTPSQVTIEYAYNMALNYYSLGRHYQYAAELLELGADPTFLFNGLNEVFEDDIDITSDVSSVYASLTQPAQDRVLHCLDGLVFTPLEIDSSAAKTLSQSELVQQALASDLRLQ